MSKTGEKHSKPLRNGFHDQRTKRMCFQRVCLQNSCQNAFNHSKLAHKQPNGQIEHKLKRDEKRQKLLQTAENRLEVFFVTKHQNKNLF